MQLNITVYSPDRQGVGAFDGGKITEQKPIGFPGDGSAVKRVGPLFYWAWAHAEQEGYIPSHPHQAFEIMTYVVQGKAEHGDSLGTKSSVGPGGAQVMQTGTGVHHEERFVGPDMEGFQIWFEPYLNDAVKRPPTYNEYQHEDFPLKKEGGAAIKTIIGEDSPVRLVADVKVWDVDIAAGNAYRHVLPAGRSLAALAIRGNGSWVVDGQDQAGQSFQHKDFMLLSTDADQEVTLQSGDETLRMIIIEAPTEVDYPLYRK
jgi:redox-sensitive bicupin YhaK (pirin superfamily)